MDAHKLAHGAPMGACAVGAQPVMGQGETMLLMVEDRGHISNNTVLRSLDELQPDGTASHVIPYHSGCAYTPFQGESAKS